MRKLKQSYRQKANIGRKTKHFVDQIGQSTPYRADEKIRKFRDEHKELTGLCNDIEFLNPHGLFEVYEDSTVDNIKCEVNRILESQSLMWRHAPGLLILFDNCELTGEANAVLTKLRRMNYIRESPIDDVEDVKGLEFQHVFIFISKSLYQEIENGFKGPGNTVYNQRRLLRIPFSRAKDSLVIFAVDNS